MNTKFFLLLIGAISLFLLPQLTHAQWTNDPWNGMVMVTAAEGNQQSLKMGIFEGTRYTMYFWNDLRDPDLLRAYYQILSSEGVPLLSPDGEPLIAGSNYRTEAAFVIPDGLGGIIAIFEKYPDSSGYSPRDIYGQRFDQWGQPLWGPTGLPLVVWSGSEDISPDDVVYDSSGGFFVTWGLTAEWTGADLYAQKFDRQGQRLWGDYGVPLSTLARTQTPGLAVPDEQGGLITVWEDNHEGLGYTYYLYTQHLDENGEPFFEVNGTPVLTQTGQQIAVGGLWSRTSDGRGGGVWSYATSGYYHYNMLFRLNGFSSTILWSWTSTYGPGYPGQLMLSPVDSSIWASISGDLYRFDIWGNPLFGPNGIEDGGGIFAPTSHGVIVVNTWFNHQGTRIIARHISSAGRLMWRSDVALGGLTPGGGAIFVAEAVTTDGDDGVVVAFIDNRNQGSYANSDISAQRVLANGQLGNPPFTPPPKEYLPIGPIDDPSGPLKVTISGDGIELNLPQASWVKLELYDLLGRRVAVLEEGYRNAGLYASPLHKLALASGVYILRLSTPQQHQAVKIILNK